MALVNLSAKVNHYSGMQKNVTNVLFSYLVTCGNENLRRNTQLHQYAKTKGWQFSTGVEGGWVFVTQLISQRQPRPQGLLAFQYGGGKREDPGTQRTKTIADWCIP